LADFARRRDALVAALMLHPLLLADWADFAGDLSDPGRAASRMPGPVVAPRRVHRRLKR
jgi:hypothetical protein